jgi:hypothetical protein
MVPVHPVLIRKQAIGMDTGSCLLMWQLQSGFPGQTIWITGKYDKAWIFARSASRS